MSSTLALRKACKLCGILFGLLAALLLSVFLLIQTSPVQRMLERMAGNMLSAEIEIALHGLDGFLPFDVRVASVTCSDAGGEFLEANGVRLHWSPAALLRGRIGIRALSADRIEMRRLPRGEGQVSPSEISFPGLPQLRLADISIREILLGPELAGEEVRLSLQGSFRNAPAVRGGFKLARLAPQGPQTLLMAEYAEEKLALRCDISGPVAGLLARGIGLEGAGPLRVSMHGEGPLDGWRGEASVTLGQSEALGLDLQLGVSDETVTSRMDGGVFLPETLLPAWSAVAGDAPVPLAARVAYHTGTATLSWNATLSREWAVARLSGSAELRRERLDLQAGLNVKRAERLEPALEGFVSGSFRTALRAEGSLSSLQAGAELSVPELEYAGFAVKGGALTAEVGPLDLKRGWKSARSLAVQASAEKISAPRGPLFSRPADLRLEAQRSGHQAVRIRELSLETANTGASLQGEVAQSGVFRANLQASGRIGELPLVRMPDLHGGFEVSSDIRGNWKVPLFSASWKGRADELQGLPGPASALTGDAVQLSGACRLQDKTVLVLEEATVSGAGFRLTAGGRMRLPDTVQEMKWQLQGLDLPGLAPHSGVRGSVSAAGSLHGPWSGLQARTRVRIEDLALRERPLGRCTLRIEAATGSGDPRGRWSLDLEMTEGPNLKTEGDFRLRGDTITLSDIRGDAASASFSGSGSLDLGNRSVQGSLRAALQNLSDLDPLLPAPLSGSARLEAGIQGPLASPSLQAELSAEDLGFRDYSARGLRAEAELSDAAELRGSFSLRVKQAKAAGASVEELRLQGSGSRSEGGFDLHLQGSKPKAFFLDTRGSWSSASGNQTLELTSGKSSLQGLEASWSRPVRMHAAGNYLELRAERINLAGASSSLELSVQGETVRGELSLQGLPLSNVALQGVPRFRGTADADLKLQGTLQAPVLRAECGVRNLKPASAQDGETPEASIRAVATYEEGEFGADVRLSADQESELRSSVALPGLLSLRPATFRLQKEMNGSLQVDLELETLSRIFPMADQHVEGRLQGGLDLSGTYEQPLLSGDLEMSGGEYEHLRTGTVLKDIRVNLALRGREARLRTLQATDGEDGTLRGEGNIGFSAGSPFCDLSFKLQDARLLRLDLARGTISGDLRFRMAPSGSSIAGELTFFPLELSIPERSAPGMEGLKVVELNGAGGPVKTEKKEARQQGGFDPSLDIRMHVPGGCYVRWRGLDSEWKGDLSVGGTVTRPLVMGRMTLVRGHMDLLTKRFNLESGTISFFKRFPPEPLLDLRAVHDGADTTTIISITGPADQPSISLQSDPAYPQEEILSRLLFGRELGEITPLQAVKLALAVRTLTGKGGEDFTQKLRRFVFLDELDIRQSEEEEEGTVVGVGKYLNENIYFKVEQGADPESGQVTVEIEITPQISVETEAGAVNQGVDINWQYRY